MRVSSGMIHDAGVLSMQKQTASLLHTQQQVASGRRLLVPSDDPLAAARALELTQARTGNALMLDNQKAAGEALGIEENSLTAVGDLIDGVRTLAVQAGNAGLTASDRLSILNDSSRATSSLFPLQTYLLSRQTPTPFRAG